MDFSPDLQQLIKTALNSAQTRSQLPRLHPTKNGHAKLLSGNPAGDAKAEKLIQFWISFHNHFKYNSHDSHDSFQAFCEKSTFCSAHTVDDIEADDLLTLLADRTFLFMQYSQFHDNSAHPCLLFLYLPTRLSDESFEELKAQREAQIEQARKTGFVPTDAHWQAYQELERNRNQLLQALHRRITNLKRYGVPEGAKPDAHVEPFTLSIPAPSKQEKKPSAKAAESPTGEGESSAQQTQPTAEEAESPAQKTQPTAENSESSAQETDTPPKKTPTPTERKLSILFRAYLSAMVKQAYRYRYKAYVNLPEDQADWTHEIHCISEYLQKNRPNTNHALVFFHLFTSCAEKLAKHTLTTYTFALPTSSQKADYPSDQVNPNISRRNECQIMLYDHLLKLLPPRYCGVDELSYAKFEFYAFTQFQWYFHYDTPTPPEDPREYRPEFQLIPNRADGVDDLGNLLRFHISYCIPNKFEWLMKRPNHKSCFQKDKIKTLLQKEAAALLPPKLLVEKIIHYVDEGKKESGEVLALLQEELSTSFPPESLVDEIVYTLEADERADSNELISLLLEEASISLPSRRLIKKIRRYLATDDGKDKLEQYEKESFDSSLVPGFLERICKAHKLYYYSDAVRLEYSPHHNHAPLAYSAFLLEHEMKELLHEEARKKLRDLAQKRFGHLFFSNDPFGSN